MNVGRLVGVFLLIGSWGSVWAEVGDPTIRTDHPYYAGDGAFQEVADCVRFATAGKTNAHDQAVAMYLWLLSHQWHLASPQDWSVPGRVPDTAQTRDYENVVYDANRGRFSYGYGLCGTVHAWNEPYWKSLGMNARRRAFPGHTNSEIYYDRAWRAFDTDMAGLVFCKDGTVAGYTDIAKDPSLVDAVRGPLPHYPFAWPSDYQAMKKGWQEVAKKDAWYSMYNGGYEAHPGIVHIRTGETFTRWYDRDHFGGPDKRRFWHHQSGGPQRRWTFFDNGVPHHDGAESNARGIATYCNGEFVYAPDLPSGAFREGVVSQTGPVGYRNASPRLYSENGEPCSVTFGHFSPYVICGDPIDDANPMSAQATDGFVVELTSIGIVSVEVSANEGLTWKTVVAQNPKRLDLTEFVKGRYGWQLRLTWNGESGLDAIRMTTTTQVAQSYYPRLKPDGAQVAFRAQGRGVVAVLPDFSLPESLTGKFEAKSLRSKNVVYQRRSEKIREAYKTTDNQPGTVAFLVKSPAALLEVRAAFRYQVRVPPPRSHDYHIDVSTDDGQSWRTIAKAEIPTDNEFSSGWLAGRATLGGESKEALVRFHMYAGGHRTGVIDAQIYGVYKVPQTKPMEIEFGWLENGELKRHQEVLAADQASRTFKIRTGSAIVDRFIRLSN